ncbi:MAG: glycosyltransferase family 4 protein [Patescibacteria group bacterium]
MKKSDPQILFIINGPININNSITISGGDIRLFEIIKHLTGYQIEILTTPNGKKLLQKFSVPHKKIHIIDYILTNTIYSHLLIFLKSFFQLPSSLNNFQGITYSSCEHLYDVLPALKLKLFNHCPWYAVYHNVYDYPWKEKRGNTPLIRRYIYWLNRWFSGIIIKTFANKILAVSQNTKKRLIAIKKINPEKIKAVACGVDLPYINQINKKYQSEAGRQYDAAYLGRLDHAKGIIDLIQIWQHVCQQLPQAKLLIIGSGSSEFEQIIMSLIKKYNLIKNINFVGTIYQPAKKYRLLNSAKLFVFPSHQENWGIAIGEAMATKLPVLAYDLAKIKPIWKNGVQWISFANTTTFAQQIIRYLSDKKLRQQLIRRSSQLIKNYNWSDIARNEIVKSMSGNNKQS